MTVIYCALCNQPVDPVSRMVLRKASGYAEQRGATGGVHGLRDKEWHDDYAHVICLERKKQGHRFGQASLEMEAA